MGVKGREGGRRVAGWAAVCRMAKERIAWVVVTRVCVHM
jgi:hypothetical protein